MTMELYVRLHYNCWEQGLSTIPPLSLEQELSFSCRECASRDIMEVVS